MCSCPWLYSPKFLDAGGDKFFALRLTGLNMAGKLMPS